MSDDTRLELARRINGERLVVLGWPRAILLQVAHPLIGAGVYRHSSFRQSARASVARLRSTVGAMLAITFGDCARRDAAVAGIRAIHRRVNGVLTADVGPFRAGTPYSAEDPELLLWVHTTLIESIVITYGRLVGPLSAAERDDYCAASSALPVDLGADAAAVPRTWDALVATNQRVIASGTLAVGPETRVLASALLDEGPSRLVPPARWLNRTITIGLLPEPVRALYQLDWSPRHQRRLDQLATVIQHARRATPDRLARFADSRRTGLHASKPSGL